MIIADGRGFPIALYSSVFELYDQGRLVRLGASGDSKRMSEFELIRIISANHGG
jgi:hypothetical protein